jgi:RNA polymerase sigma-70 factor (ECF subfamily)
MEVLQVDGRWDLVRDARGGDRNAFDALIGPLIAPAFRLAMGMLHDREAAEDAVQEAALRAWRKLGNLREGSDLRPWFLAIVANQCRSTRRARWWGVVKLASPGESLRSPELRLSGDLDLLHAIRSLNPDRRLALILHYYMDLPLEEVAAITNTPVGTVKSRIHRAVQDLRPRLALEEATT